MRAEPRHEEKQVLPARPPSRRSLPPSREAHITHSRYKIYETDQPHFMTATLVGWLPLFARPDIVQIIYGSWQFLQQNRGLKLFGYVIMENHLHWVASSPDLSKDAGDFKSFTARRIIDRFQEQRAEPILRQLAYFKQAHKSGQIYQLWQDGHHPQQIVSEEMMLQKLEYMHNNPIRRGYVDDAADWRYSSARNYAGRTGLIEVVSDWRRE